MIRIYVEGMDGGIKDMLAKMKVMGILDNEVLFFSEDHADVIFFSGGADVSPSLYGERNIASSCNYSRDVHCVELYKNAKKNGKKVLGICRGAQFISVMLGGKMWQDIESHPYMHGTETGLIINSTHHQGIQPGEHLGEIIHRPNFAFSATGNDGKMVRDVKNVESYRGDKHFCVQWHPEYFQEWTPAWRWYAENLKNFLEN